MLIGLCGSGYPHVRSALGEVLGGDDVVDIPDSAAGQPTVDVLVPMNSTVDGALLDATRPRLILQFGVGVQGVDFDAARQRGVPVANVPGGDTGNSVAVAEIALFHVLALLRRYPHAQRTVADGGVGEPVGTMLAGKTVAVIGVGAIGGAAIDRLRGFDAKPIGVGRRHLAERPAASARLAPEDYYRVDARIDALGRAHVAIVCCPLTEQTRGLVGEAELAAMPAGGYLVNVGRGPVVQYDALLNALRSGHLAGAGLDVAWQEPIDPRDPLLRENVMITPHIGGVTWESGMRMARAFAANVENLRAGREIANRLA